MWYCHSYSAWEISIHAPREGGDIRDAIATAYYITFQSTPPARGATRNDQQANMDGVVFQSTPPARGATSQQTRRFSLLVFQSTPPARGATLMMSILRSMLEFQSTPPARGATRIKARFKLFVLISIHAPREGGDYAIHTLDLSDYQFQSTPPARGATYRSHIRWDRRRFQSTPPARGATVGHFQIAPTVFISIHAPREGGDSGKSPPSSNVSEFQSTPPARGATISCSGV